MFPIFIDMEYWIQAIYGIVLHPSWINIVSKIMKNFCNKVMTKSYNIEGLSESSNTMFFQPNFLGWLRPHPFSYLQRENSFAVKCIKIVICVFLS